MDSDARTQETIALTQDSNARAEDTNARMQDSNPRAQGLNGCIQDVTARPQDLDQRFKKASFNKPTWDQINQQLNRKAFKKACVQGWNVQSGKVGLNSRAQKGMGPNKASGHKGGISRQGSKRG